MQKAFSRRWSKKLQQKSPEKLDTGPEFGLRRPEKKRDLAKLYFVSVFWPRLDSPTWCIWLQQDESISTKVSLKLSYLQSLHSLIFREASQALIFRVNPKLFFNSGMRTGIGHCFSCRPSRLAFLSQQENMGQTPISVAIGGKTRNVAKQIHGTTKDHELWGARSRF